MTMVGQRSWAKHRRTQARRRIRSLLGADAGRCHWCRAPLVLLEDVMQQPEARLIGGGLVGWRTQRGKARTALFATVDHVVPLREYIQGVRQRHLPPANHWSNLVAACLPCNQRRAATPPTVPHTPCERCGKPVRRHAFCRRCSPVVHALLSGMLPD